MENESQRIQVNPRNIHYVKRNLPPPPPLVHINNVQLPKKSNITVYTLTGDLPGTNTFSQKKQLRIPPPQNVCYPDASQNSP
jgi:hypothetical protein